MSTEEGYQNNTSNENGGNYRGGRGGRGRGDKGGRGRSGANTKRVYEQCRAGLVRGVVSGDTLLIMDLPEKAQVVGPPKEIQMTFLGLRAPILGKRTVQDGKVIITKDERWAWESREFLRNMCVGKSVVYRVEHEMGGRHYGEVWLNEKNVRNDIILNGWADYISKGRKNRDGDYEVSEEQQALEELKEEAKSRKKGIWKDIKDPNSQEGIRKIKYRDPPRRDDPVRSGRDDDLFQFFEKVKNKSLHAIVEQVTTGSNLRVLLTDTLDNVPIQLSGVRCPVFKSNNDADCEPFSREAKFFTEFNLLHRNVQVTIDGIDKFNNFFATVEDLQGNNICLNLLQMGLANFVEWSAKPASIAQYKEAEKEAQKNKMRYWGLKQPLPNPVSDGNKPSAGKTAGAKGQKRQNESETTNFTGKVVEIVNAGTVTVRVNKGDRGYVDRKISFSSIKVPVSYRQSPEEAEPVAEEGKKDTPGKTDNEKKAVNPEQKAKEEEDKRQSSYAWEGKEFLRNLLIGKKVQCVFDYVRPSYRPKGSGEPVPPKPFWSVFYTEGKNEKNRINVARELLARGLATVVPHGKDEPRSADFQELIIAEKQAAGKNFGLHSPPGRKPLHSVLDLSDRLSVAKAKGHLPFLKRTGRTTAVVDHVYSGSRFKIYVPQEQCTVNFAIAGVSTDKLEKKDNPNPKKGRNNNDINFLKTYPPETPANIAFHDARDNLFQRQVEVEIDTIDKGGNFIGQVWVNKKDWGLHLVAEGLAKMFYYSASKLKNFSQYQDAEQAAKERLIGVWENYNAAAEQEAKDERKRQRDAEKEAEFTETKVDVNKRSQDFQVEVTEILTGTDFYYQAIGEETQALSDLMKVFQNQDWHDKSPYNPPEPENLVAAQFTADDRWYRAKVVNIFDESRKKKKAKSKQPEKEKTEKGSEKGAEKGAEKPAEKEGEETKEDAPSEEFDPLATPPKANKPPTYEIEYIDYGNKEILESSRLRSLPDAFNLKALPRQSHEAKLAFIKSPGLDEEFGRDAAALFKELVWGKTLIASIQGYEAGKAQLSLGDPEAKMPINAALVTAGLARVERRRRPSKYYEALQKEEAKAKSQRTMMWQYGDAPDSDDERQERNLLR